MPHVDPGHAFPLRTLPGMTDRPSAVTAVQRNDFVDWARAVDDDPAASADERQLAARGRAACTRIGGAVHAEHRRLVDVLAEHGITSPMPGEAVPTQRHELVLRIGVDDLDPAVEALESEGYTAQVELSDGAGESRRRTSGDLVLRRSDETTTVVRLRWREPSTPGRLGRALRPTFADWVSVPLPRSLWWAYPLVRVGRLAAARVGLDRRDHALLEPFLVTPSSLLEPLFDAADIGTDDVVVDLGCGDGRIVVEAARSRGCRAIGIEQSPDLARAARQRVTSSGQDALVTIVEGDGLDDGLRDTLATATVVFLFLPTGIARRVVPALLERLTPGSRITLHEQSPLPAGLSPDTSEVLVGEDALTVAHHWLVASAAPREAGRRTEDEKNPGEIR
jgi:SAM-dependent methyltransferase